MRALDGGDPARILRLALELSPLALVWPGCRAGADLWRTILLTFPDSTTRGYDLAYSTWPVVALVGPVLLMALAVTAHRLRRTGRLTPLAGIAGVMGVILLTVRPEWQRLAPHIGRATPLDLARALDPAVAAAAGLGLVAIGGAVRILCGERTARPDLQRARSDNHGHADWLAMRDALRLFPGADPAHGGLVVGEAYRVDRDRVGHLPFEPDDPRSWGKGGTAPLLIDSCRSGPTHVLVVARSLCSASRNAVR